MGAASVTSSPQCLCLCKSGGYKLLREVFKNK